MADTLEDLAARCESATGPDRELDIAIYEACVGCFHDPVLQSVEIEPGEFELIPVCRKCKKEGAQAIFKLFSRSLDAAMTLVPEGWRWIMREACPDKNNPDENGFFARLETRDFEIVTWGKGNDWITDVVSGQDVHCWAATPALALCAAALRAIAKDRLASKGSNNVR